MKTTLIERIAIAEKVPQLGHGGLTIGRELARLASNLKRGHVVVETAPWLGSASAFLMAGLPEGTELHAFDLWTIDKHWQTKARVYNQLDFKIGEDLEHLWRENVSRVRSGRDVAIFAHRGDVRNAVWASEDPIALFVDDISNTTELIESTLKIFGPSILLGAPMIFMDYQFPQCEEQREYLKAHADQYEFVKLYENSKAALFRKRA